MFLVLAIFLFVFAGIASALSRGEDYINQNYETTKTHLRIMVSSRNATTKNEEIRKLYKKLTDTYLVLYEETPEESERWQSNLSLKLKNKHQASLGHWSGFGTHKWGVTTLEFNWDHDTRHASVQFVEDLLGYSVSGIPRNQFWKVASDFEERFGYWSEVFAYANHPLIAESHTPTSWIIEMAQSPILDVPIRGLVKNLQLRDHRYEKCWKTISEFFNDDREKEIVAAFKNNDESFLNSLSELLGEDVTKLGMRETILAVSRKEKWYAHTYINPALFYHEYGLMLFGLDMKVYNQWRSVFGVPELTQEECQEAWDNLQRLQNRQFLLEQERIKAAKEKEALEKVPFYPYKK